MSFWEQKLDQQPVCMFEYIVIVTVTVTVTVTVYVYVCVLQYLKVRCTFATPPSE